MKKKILILFLSFILIGCTNTEEKINNKAIIEINRETI
jgi:uncharacterized protein YcfL